MGAQAHKERINNFLHTFMQEEVLKTHQLDNIRAVVITGQVPSSAIADVETLARQVAGIEHLEALSGINPHLLPLTVSHSLHLTLTIIPGDTSRKGLTYRK
jgi:hypothetical protein